MYIHVHVAHIYCGIFQIPGNSIAASICDVKKIRYLEESPLVIISCSLEYLNCQISILSYALYLRLLDNIT